MTSSESWRISLRKFQCKQLECSDNKTVTTVITRLRSAVQWTEKHSLNKNRFKKKKYICERRGNSVSSDYWADDKVRVLLILYLYCQRETIKSLVLFLLLSSLKFLTALQTDKKWKEKRNKTMDQNLCTCSAA